MARRIIAALLIGGILSLGVSLDAEAQAARDYVYIVGSSTVYPFATVVAERFGRTTRYRTPKVESTGSGGGIKLFCDGIGTQYPDIVNSSRPIERTETEACNSNGVGQIIEARIGYDGIVIANSVAAPDVSFRREDIFLALARRVPDQDGELVDNPYRTWADIDPALPNTPIEVLGPPPTSGTRDAFVELTMEAGCRSWDWIAALERTDYDRFRELCHTIREDGAFIEAGENDNLIVQKIEANPRAFGIFGFSFLDQNAEKVKGARIDGFEPTFEAIATGDYPISRPLFFYVKKAHVGVIPGLEAYLEEFTSERAWGDDGYLSDRGLVPLPPAERQQVAADVRNLNSLAARERRAE